jgi:hypothetical protein
LIWSANPTWTRDQVAAQLIGSTDNIDAKNPTLVGLLGSGRVNAFKAVSATIAPPTLRGLKGIADGATIASAPQALVLTTKSVLDGSTVTAANFELRYAGADGVFNDNDAIVPLSPGATFYGTNQVVLTPGSPLALGVYRLTARSGLKNPFGQTLDGNADGVATPGDDYVTTFSIGAPLAPAGASVAFAPSSQSEAIIRWTDGFVGETGFVIERSASSTFATIDRTMNAGPNTNQYYDWGLSQGETYYYRVRAANAVGAGAWSATLTHVIPPPPPGIPNAPTDFAARTPSYSLSEVELSWTDASVNELGFVIERSTSATFESIDKTLNPIANSNRYNDWGLQVGTTYYYRLRAVNGPDASAWVSLAYSVPVPTTAPNAPANLTASTVPWSATEAELKWADNSIDESSFTIERSTTDDFAIVTTIAASPSSGAGQYNTWGLTPGTTYYFRIRAANVAGPSAWSNTATLVLPPL